MLKTLTVIADITVDPMLNIYELGDLKSSTAYEVQISGFTQTGEGVRSKASLVTTNQYQGYIKLLFFSFFSKQIEFLIHLHQFQLLFVHLKPSSFHRIF